ncbi:MAG: 3'-5' exonuclease [Verrucomicrobia bacterium]|nr:3'-5' exonuclease [Verrucomicrobiota bacterium]
MLGIFLDTETNGLNAFKHKAIEIAFKIVDLQTALVIDSYESVVFQTYEEWQSSDLESLQINGFNWEDVSYGKNRETISTEIQACFNKNNIKRGSAVFICQNPSFDRAFFSQFIDADLQEEKLWPYHWLDLASMYWAVSLLEKKKNPSLKYPWETGLSKDLIAKTHNLPPEKKPHRAMNGVDHLILCYKTVIGFPLSS